MKGSLVLLARRDGGVTQADLADRLGLQRHTLADIEADRIGIDEETMDKIMSAIDHLAVLAEESKDETVRLTSV